MNDILNAGTTVKLVGQCHGKMFIVESSEMHNGLRFYRLKELEGSLFLRSSLALVTSHRTLRVYDLTPEQKDRFFRYLDGKDQSIWEALYEEQQAAYAARADQVRRDFAAGGEKIPDTSFNRKALGIV